MDVRQKEQELVSEGEMEETKEKRRYKKFGD